VSAARFSAKFGKEEETKSFQIWIFNSVKAAFEPPAHRLQWNDPANAARDSQATKGFIMSRIGKKPIPLPTGVKYTVSGNTVLVEGPKGKVTALLPGGISLVQKDGNLVAERQNDKQAAFHGLARALVFNAVTGVTTGWTKDIDIVGIGYRAEMKGKNMVVFTLGYSHPIEFPLPTGISVEIDPKQTHLTISGIDRQKVGQVAADMRSLRKPDPYKNKGVRYTGEKLKKKVGKTGAK
jgi:large subunit ribosomal protein L6